MNTAFKVLSSLYISVVTISIILPSFHIFYSIHLLFFTLTSLPYSPSLYSRTQNTHTHNTPRYKKHICPSSIPYKCCAMLRIPYYAHYNGERPKSGAYAHHLLHMHNHLRTLKLTYLRILLHIVNSLCYSN